MTRKRASETSRGTAFGRVLSEKSTTTSLCSEISRQKLLTAATRPRDCLESMDGVDATRPERRSLSLRIVGESPPVDRQPEPAYFSSLCSPSRLGGKA